MTSSKNYKCADRTAPGHEQNIQYIVHYYIRYMYFIRLCKWSRGDA